MKKNVYLIQPTFMSSNSVHFPYGIGALASYAWNFNDIKKAYDLKGVFFLREKTDEVVASMESPFAVGFSCYMWNIEYNKVLAKKIKERFPSCTIIFGGPQVSYHSKLLENCAFIDVLIYNEGEIPFCTLLRVLNGEGKTEDINNISFRENGVIKTTPIKLYREFDFPSPFQSGFFDRLMREHPDLDFIPLIETNRGCPNHCAYCSWGDMNAKVRLFPMERVLFDLNWVGRHKMEFLGAIDANFGMFSRDEEITDRIIELHEKTGFPKKFQVSYAKDSSERVFRIIEKLNRIGMDKGATLSFQTMSPVAQKNIGRANIDLSFYKELQKKYIRSGIPTYTDLILGLPGETYQSFVDGVEELLENGQHTSLFVHLCEWLPLSIMGNAAYMQKYKLEYTVVPLNQPHASIIENDEVQEYSRIVTSTYSMSKPEWKQTVLFSACVLCFHHLGLLRLPALFLYHEFGIKYSDFYSGVLHKFLLDEYSVFSMIRKRLDDVIQKGASVLFVDKRFGNIGWPFEEYAFLSIVSQKDRFYGQISDMMAEWLPETDLREELLRYQSFVVKTAGVTNQTFYGTRDWKSFFSALTRSESASLKKREVQYVMEDESMNMSLEEYAQKVLWYGRRGGNNLYESEIMEKAPTGEGL